jgi:hypothetical protein
MAIFASAKSMEAETSSPEKAENCGVMFYAENGEVKTEHLESLHVLTLNDNVDFALPKDAPKKIEGIICGRQSIVPERNDYKVLVSGYFLYIVSGDRVGALEILGGQLRFRLEKGNMTENEMPLVQKFLDESQPFFYKKE